MLSEVDIRVLVDFFVEFSINIRIRDGLLGNHRGEFGLSVRVGGWLGVECASKLKNSIAGE